MLVSENGMKLYSKYKLPPIYTIGILDFELEGVSKSNRIIRHFSIREDEDDQGPFTDSVHYITVELPKFKKAVSKLTTTQDFMLYLIKNSRELTEIPKEFFGKGFDKLLETCKFANMTEEEQMTYVRQMKVEWDRENQLKYAESRGEGPRFFCTSSVKRQLIAQKHAIGVRPLLYENLVRVTE